MTDSVTEGIALVNTDGLILGLLLGAVYGAEDDIMLGDDDG